MESLNRDLNCSWLSERRYNMSDRAILHIDMNNFYASVECMMNPDLKPYPIAVCGSQEDRHGIVLAKNYKAKAFGVSTGEAIWQAKQKCPNLVIVPPHYEQYMRFSKLAREIYGSVCSLALQQKLPRKFRSETTLMLSSILCSSTKCRKRTGNRMKILSTTWHF